MPTLLRRLFLLLVFLAAYVPGRGQVLPRQIICEYQRGATPKSVDRASSRRQLGTGIDLLTFASEALAAKHFRALLLDPDVRAIQYNYRVESRAAPNDPQYPRQASNFARAGFEEAWNLTTGGLTPDGHPIVTAVLDAGFDVDHEDLAGNLWRNTGEIAGDGEDNDGNGYVDDVHGWNFVGDAANFDGDSHGTAVAGLLGAVGDNGIGVTGSNWDAALILFQINTVADIIAAYEYVIDQRQRYNASGGTSGSFVVATNASFGIEGATCAQYPVWGGMYDRLGEVGILTAASVSNIAEDVDTYGDMPTDCPSRYIIGVTNLDVDDRLFTASAYGAVAVDLAAPGEGSFTTRPGGTYSTFGSTSAAAPYITGAVSLLYATPCAKLQELTRTDPSAAADLIRDALLATVVPRTSLQRKTVTGGSLDVAAAQLYLLDNCSGPAVDFAVESVFPNPSDGRLRMRTTALALSAAVRVTVYDVLGRDLGPAPLTRTEGEAGSLELDLSGFPAGLVLLIVTDGDMEASAKAIIR